ncbi:hypothetical protein BRD56_05970 [Thermoplasmatales archaeon SW_10_69_26]|nr:MAG: hypothetical protein BRD56_05970 [Thermoplasmatales archaeon SW_10_69_26]
METYFVEFEIEEGERIPINSIEAVLEKQNPNRTDKVNPDFVSGVRCEMEVKSGCSGAELSLVNNQSKADVITRIENVGAFTKGLQETSSGYQAPAGYELSSGYFTKGERKATQTGYGYDTSSPVSEKQGYGYGYGYETGDRSQVDFGYGYGYGYTNGTLHLIYEIDVAASRLDVGENYYLTALAETSSEIVGQAQTSGGGETDVGLVLDESGSMSGDPIDEARTAGKDLVDKLGSADQSGLVSFESDGDEMLRQSLTGDHSKTKTAIDNISAGGSTAIGAGISLSHEDFNNSGRDDAKDFMVVMADGGENEGSEPRKEAQAAKDNDIDVFSVAFSSGADSELMWDLASEPKRDHDADRGSALAGSPPGFALCFVDNDNDAAVDSGEPLYAATAGGCNSGAVTTADLRLTAAGGEDPGTQVETGDSDLGDPYTAMPSGTLVDYHDEDSEYGYSVGDNVFVDIGGTGSVAAGDIYLSGSNAGTSVQSGDSAVGNTLSTSPPSGLAVDQWDFLDEDGNATYSSSDTVYADADQSLTANSADRRLGDVSAGSFGSEVRAAWQNDKIQDDHFLIAEEDNLTAAFDSVFETILTFKQQSAAFSTPWIQFTVTQAGGGGGGGGGAAPPTGQQVQVGNNQPFNGQQGAQVTVTQGLPPGVNSVSVNLANVCTGCSLQITTSSSPPPGTPPDPSGADVLSYMQVDMVDADGNVVEGNVDDATIEFDQPPNTNEDQVMLLHDTGQWQPTPTQCSGGSCSAQTGSFSVFAVALDVEPPTISSTEPTGTIEKVKPTISANWSDNQGVDPDTLELTIDGEQRDSTTGDLQVDENGFEYIHTTDLSEGEHTVEATVQDFAKQSTTETWTFTVSPEACPDGPQILQVKPLDGATGVDPTTPIEVSIEEGSCPITDTTLTINGQDVSASIEDGTVTASIPSDLQSEETMDVRLVIEDSAGNSAPRDWSYETSQAQEPDETEPGGIPGWVWIVIVLAVIGAAGWFYMQEQEN